MRKDDSTGSTSESGTEFYVTGGTLRADSPSYVERQADRDLLDGLLKGEFCYVLTSRQMGKSSLMVRNAQTLRCQGINVAVLDLAAIGQNLTPDQWFDGLSVRLGRQLRLEDEFDEFWRNNARLGPCQRFFAALREIALEPFNPSTAERASVPAAPEATPSARNLVVFVDELDTVRSLPFPTDEFFAAIRECYTRRTEDPELYRVTFCLLGVATPTQLIRNAADAPFNIGRRIELKDFSRAEMTALTRGLMAAAALNTRVASAILDRIYFWTAGHPYLTQKLCRTAANELAKLAPASRRDVDPVRGASALVDRLCLEQFLSDTSREQDDNLIFVRNRLLRSDCDHAALLQLYARVLAGKRVKDDVTSDLVHQLHLAGIIRGQDGILSVRNRIYAKVFSRLWITQQQVALNKELGVAVIPVWRRQRTLALVAGIVVLLVIGGWLAPRLGLGNSSDPLAEPIVAVLPFEYRSDQGTNQPLVEGLSEAVSEVLTRLQPPFGGFQVVPGTELRREGVRTPRDARQVFGVNRVLSGVVEEGRLTSKVRMYLLDARTFTTLTNTEQEVASDNLAAVRERLAVLPASWFRLKPTPDAARILRDGQTQDPQAAEWYVRGLGQQARLGQSGTLQAAIEALRLACQLDPAFALAQAALGEAYLAIFERTRDPEQFAEAEKHAARAIELNQNLPQAFSLVGQLHQKRGRVVAARRALEQAVALDRRNPVAWRRFASLLETLDESKKAEEFLRRSVRLAPNHWAGHNELGAFYYRQGNYAAAEKCFKKVAELAPESGLGLAFLGGIYHLQGRSDSETTLRSSLLKHETAEGLSNLGTVLFYQGRYEVAVDCFDKARRLQAGEHLIWGNLADALRLAGGKREEVLAAYRRATELAAGDLTINPRDAETRAARAFYLAQLGQKPEAKKELEQARTEAPQSGLILFLGVLVNETLANRDEALNNLAAALARGYSIAEVEKHPDLVTLRRDPQFAVLRKK